MSRCRSSRGSLEMGQLPLRGRRDDSPSPPKKQKSPKLPALVLSSYPCNKLENLAINRPFRGEKERDRELSLSVCCTRTYAICTYTGMFSAERSSGTGVSCHPAISDGISCRPGSGVKGVARQLVKRIIRAYVTQAGLMPRVLLNHSWNCRETQAATGWCKTWVLFSPRYWISPLALLGE